MRRADFKGGPGDADALFATVLTGQLGIADNNGWPRIVPVNFVCHNDRIYFHGARDGEKFALFAGRPKVCFSVYDEFSYIPSTWRSPLLACPASVYYRSAHVRGTGSLVEDLAEKGIVTQKLMEKIQPQGGHEPVSADSPLYRKALDEVAIFRIDPVEITVKVKFGQNLSADTRRDIARRLRDRADRGDIETAQVIERTLRP
ncbi:MAG: pyridoxamine 5'-phosphate oxidase family protein [Nitrospinae bacterium]|nr:pyridoxamine 5'-phosphate oxidase family protein [Nitrospinota bacterium]